MSLLARPHADFLAHLVPFLPFRDLVGLQRAGAWLNTYCGEVWLLQHMRAALHGGPRLSLRGARTALATLQNVGILGAFKGLCAHGPAAESASAFCAYRVTPRMYFERTDSPYEVRKSDEWLYGAVVLQQLRRSLSNVRAFVVDTLMRKHPEYAFNKYGVSSCGGLQEVLLDSVPLSGWTHRDLLAALLGQVKVLAPPMFATCLHTQARQLRRARRRAAWRHWRVAVSTPEKM